MTTNLDNILGTLVEANAALEQLPKLKEQIVYLNHDLNELGKRNEQVITERDSAQDTITALYARIASLEVERDQSMFRESEALDKFHHAKRTLEGIIKHSSELLAATEPVVEPVVEVTPEPIATPAATSSAGANVESPTLEPNVTSHTGTETGTQSGTGSATETATTTEATPTIYEPSPNNRQYISERLVQNLVETEQYWDFETRSWQRRPRKSA